MLWENIKVYDIDFYLPLDYGRRTHKLCRLPNGILTLLISDPADTYVGCSLSVATGSHNDPKEIPGLAHLCEHMILTAGSKEYPQAELYHDLITKYNGHHNAFTTGEQTTFYLELPNMSVNGEVIYEQVLEVFASFFKRPLFQPVLTRKEIYAINSEHENNVSSTVKIMYHCTRLLANKQHPFSHFSTGNIQSYGKASNLHSMLSKFSREHLSSSRMTLCLRGPNSVNTLARIALSKFGGIPVYLETGRGGPVGTKLRSNDTWLPSPKNGISEFKILENAWKNKYRGITCFRNPPIEKIDVNIIAVESKNRKVMRLLFPVCYKTSTLTRREVHYFSQIWSELMGDESEGSIYHCLTKKSWITECNAYVSEFTFEELGLVLQLTLTDSGWENTHNICQYVLTLVIPELLAVSAYKMGNFVEEQNRINLITFLYQVPEESPMDECSRMSCLLQENFRDIDPRFIFQKPPYTMSLGTVDVPNTPSNIPRDNYTLWSEQGMRFQQFVSEFFSCKNIRVILLGNQITKCPILSQVERSRLKLEKDPYYGFDYWRLLVDFKQVKQKYDPEFFFRLPARNAFVPKVYSDLPPITQSLKGMSTNEKMNSFHPLLLDKSNSLYPKLISHGPSYELWAMQEAHSAPLQRHKSIISLEIVSKAIVPSVEATLHLELLSQVISSLVSMDLYPALKLGFAYELCGSQSGCPTFRISTIGFSDDIVAIVKRIFRCLQQLGKEDENSELLTKVLFRIARAMIRNRYESAASENSVKLASLGLFVALEKTIWTLEDRIGTLEELSMESFMEFCHKFLDKDAMYATVFVQGNLSCIDGLAQCLDIEVDRSQEITVYRQTNGNECATNMDLCGTKVLEPGCNYFIRHSGKEEDPSNSIVYFIQTGKRNDKYTTTLTMFTEYLFSSTLVPDLRNKKQVGYIVLSGARLLTNTIGLHITVASSNSPLDLEQKIEEYLVHLESYLRVTLHESTFRQNYLEKYLAVLRNRDKGGNGCHGMESEKSMNLMREMSSAVQHGESEYLGHRVMGQHRLFWDQIRSRDFPVCKDEMTKLVDPAIIEKLSLKDYLKFFNDKLSIRSKTRSKLSVMVHSPMLDTETASRRLFVTLEAFLKMKGFVIESDRLRRIINESGGRPSTIMKEIFKACHKQGDTLRFSAALMGEMTSALKSKLGRKLTLKKSSPRLSKGVIGVGTACVQLENDSVSAIPPTEISDLRAFKGLGS